MKHTLGILGAFSLLLSFTQPAAALSCITVSDYLKDVVGRDEITILVGTAKDQFFEDGYTSEILSVEEVKQGYAEKETFVYHEKSRDWGYLCNAGPGKEGEKGLYVASRDGSGKLNVYQRLAMNDPLIAQLETDLTKAEVTGSLSEATKTDRANQIMTTISDLFREIAILLKEYAFWTK